MEYVILAIVVLVLAVLAGGALLLRPRRRAGARPEEPSATTTPQAAAGATTTAPAAPPAPEIELPPPSAGRLVRLRARLARSQTALGKSVLTLLSRDVLDDEVWDEVEDTLISADVGVGPARQIVEDLRTKVKVLRSRTPEEVKALLKEELLRHVGPDLPRALRTERDDDRPAVIMVVGVNGTGKTTTCGKLGRVLVGDGRSVLLGAADTFRAAAADQLVTWGSRVGAEVVRRDEGAAKGGIVIAVQRELGVPVKLVGLGEGLDDLAPFEPDAFVEAILGAPPS